MTFHESCDATGYDNDCDNALNDDKEKSTYTMQFFSLRNALTSLQTFGLSNIYAFGPISGGQIGTQVTGDIGSLNALTNLQTLSLAYTQGDISRLRALTNLQELYTYGCIFWQHLTTYPRLCDESRDITKWYMYPKRHLFAYI